ncbi:MAG TPA: hypothetical protein VJ346_00520, partial [Bacteroidales bacterium]|nr:hypothetical protein [Bacteroidales bacterium]
GKVSTGALNDLEKITKQAYAMVIYFGLSDEIGNLSFYDSTGQSEYSFTKPYSEKTAEQIDKEVKKIVEQQYKRAIKVLQEHKEGLTKIGELLLEKEVLFSEDLEKIFGKRPQKETLFQSVEASKPKRRGNSTKKETTGKTSSESKRSSKKPQVIKSLRK